MRSWSNLLLHKTDLYFGAPHSALNVGTLVLYFLLIFLSDYNWERHLYFEESHNTVVAYLKSKYREEYLNVKRMKREKEVLNLYMSHYCSGMVWLQEGVLWVRCEIHWVDWQGFGRFILMRTLRKWVVRTWIYFRLHHLWQNIKSTGLN